jgi:hypothetical protein
MLDLLIRRNASMPLINTNLRKETPTPLLSSGFRNRCEDTTEDIV